MPQKPNAYFFYMKHQKETRIGWRNKPFKELSTLCSPGWNAMTKEEKQIYEDMRTDSDLVVKKKKKNKQGNLDCNGRPIEFSDNLRLEKLKKQEDDLAKIRELVLSNEEALEDCDFYMIHITNYCITKLEPIVYCPAEISIGTFNLKKGFTSKFHSFLSVNIPHGYWLMVKENCEKVLKMKVQEEHSSSDSISKEKVAQKLLEFLKDQSTGNKILFCHPKYQDICTKNLESLLGYGAPQVYSLTQLTYALVDVKGFTQSEAQVEGYSTVLDDERRAYESGLCCEWHENNTENALCSTSILQKCSRNVRDYLGPVFKIGNKQNVKN